MIEKRYEKPIAARFVLCYPKNMLIRHHKEQVSKRKFTKSLGWWEEIEWNF